MRQAHTRKLAAATLVIGGLFASAGAAHAQTPTIAAVNGSTAQGSLLTITGANLNAERLAGVDNWFQRNPTAWSFEGSTPAADGILAPGGTGVYDRSVKLLGSQSIKFHSTASNPSCITTGGIGQSYNYIVLDDAVSDTEYWVRTYVRWNRRTSWPSYYMKMLYALNEAYYFQPGPPTGTAANPGGFDAAHSGASHGVGNPTGLIQNNRWYAVEVHWSTAPTRLFEAWIDGVKVYSGPTTKVGSGGLRTLLFGIINACGASNWDVEHWMDGFVVAHQRVNPSAIVEVGDNASYSTANKRIQAVESIADDAITFRLDTTGLGAGPYYVWVRNNTNALSPAFFLTGGQISGPLAPANLRILGQ